MADNAVKEALDGVVKAIGFGIVSDFRELYDAMRQISSDIRDNNSVLEQVNRNTGAIDKNLDDFQRAMFDRAFLLNARKAEKTMEGRVKLNAQRTEESMARILKAIEELNRQVKMGAAARAEEGGGGGLAEDMIDVDRRSGGGSPGGMGRGKKIAIGAALVGAAAAVGGAGAYLMGAFDSSEESSGGSLGPAMGPSGSGGTTSTPAADLSKMGEGATAAVGASARASDVISRSQMSARQKALAKISSKVPTYLSKFGGRIVNTIGPDSVAVFGSLIGGYFTFGRFISGDSWQAIGAEFAAGRTPSVSSVGGPADYVGGVVTNLAIITYLIARDIYQEENAIDIKNNVVPNFDDLEASEKTQVLNSVRGSVETYVNSLIGRTRSSDATTGIAPTSTSGSTLSGAGIVAAGAGAAMAGAAAGGGESGATQEAPPPTSDSSGQTSPGAQGGGGQEESPDLSPQVPVVSGTEAQNQFMNQIFGGVAGGTQAGAGYQQAPMNAPGAGGPSVSPSDNIATFNTLSDQAGDITTGTPGMYRPTYPLSDIDLSPDVINTIAGEARMGDPKSYYGVVNNMMNRVGGSGYGPSRNLYEVARAPGQYMGYRQASQEEAAKIRKAIQEVAAGSVPDNTNGSNEFRASWYLTGEGKGKTAYKRATAQGWNDQGGNVYFYNEDGPLGPYAPYTRQNSPSDASLQEVPQDAKPMAEGGVINPLPSDAPKASRDMSMALQPPKTPDMMEDEDEFTTSQRTIDAREKAKVSGSPKEKKKNMISSYTPYMSYLFGTMTSELSSHVNGEVTADMAFEDAMNPLS